jgi:glucokinase
MKAKRKKERWVGFDLGGTKMLAAVFNAKFRLIGSRRRKSKGAQGVKAGIERIADTIDQALADAGLERRELAGIGIGAPGMLDLNRGVLLDAPNLGWENVPLRKKLEKILDVPVTIANDVDAGTYGEYRFGAAQEARCVVGVFPGTGIGGACIYEGRVLRGRVGSCMEVGHMLLRPGGELCGCGRHGCLEAGASRLAIAAQLAAASYRGETPHLTALAGTDLAQIRSGVIAAAIAAGDKVVEKIVRQSARQIGQALITIVHLLAPDVIVLGGGLVEEMPRLYREEVTRILEEGVTPTFQGVSKVVTAQLGDMATALGAAALAAESAAETRRARR